MTTLFCWS